MAHEVRRLGRVLTEPYAVALATEMMRITGNRFGWGTASFRQSTLGLVREFLIAGTYANAGVLSDGSFDELKLLVRDRFLNDPGVGPDRARRPYAGRLPKNAAEFRPSSHRHEGLLPLASTLREDYLANWAAEMTRTQYRAPDAATTAPVPADRAAELLVAHLLQLGMHPDYITNWVAYRFSTSLFRSTRPRCWPPCRTWSRRATDGSKRYSSSSRTSPPAWPASPAS